MTGLSCSMVGFDADYKEGARFRIDEKRKVGRYARSKPPILRSFL
jgi:hypothetical protein